MNRGFELLRRHIDALRARWVMMTEEAFREGLKGHSNRGARPDRGALDGI